VTLLFGMLVAQLLLHYHLAALMLLAAAIVAHRHGIRSIWRRMSLFLIGSATLALVHVSLLLATPGSIVKLIGTLVGEPSVWPYYKVMTFSFVAAALTLGATAYGFWQLANRRLMPDYALFALLGIWIPMFMIGAFLWNVPPRYTVASLLPLLLCAFAFAQHLSDRWLQPRMRHAALVAGVLATVLIVNPVTFAKTVNAGYEAHPDHKGAAEFVHSQQIGPDDIVIAEDVLQQTYYLGAVDYWLISRAHARRFVARIDGEIRDFYTATRVISSAAMLERLLQTPRKGRIFVIGSGENQSDKRKGMRGDMDPLLHSDRFEVVYRGRDGVTTVWQATAPAPATE
jgi:hypothetical protein